MTDLARLTLDTTDVLEALSSLRQASCLRLDHPLARFMIVQSRTLGRGLAGQAFTEVCIYRVLCAVIRRQLKRQREAQELPHAPCWDQAICDLASDFRTGNAELEAWSLLYYRFVCFELDLNVEEIARFAGQTVRTLHRRQQLGVFRLTQGLLRREALKRARWRQAQLRSRLPVIKPADLLGREANLNRANKFLTGAAGQRHLILYGGRDADKTALVVLLAHRLIETNQVHHVVWIDHPEPSLDGLEGEIVARLGLARDPISLPAWFGQERCLVILDHSQALLDDDWLFAALQTAFEPARLILCANFPPAWRVKATCLDVRQEVVSNAEDLAPVYQRGSLDGFRGTRRVL